MPLIYQCPYCGAYVTIFHPRCYHCHEEIPSTLRWIAIATIVSWAAPKVAQRYRQAMERELANNGEPPMREWKVSADVPVNKARYKAMLSCRHYAGVRGDPDALPGKLAICPNAECAGAPPRSVVQILKLIPG
jgi:hypothetical protein